MSATLTLLLGVTSVSIPATILVDPLFNYVAQRYALILWLTRDTQPLPETRAILGGMVVSVLLMIAVSVKGIMSGVANPGVWTAVVVESLLTLFSGTAATALITVIDRSPRLVGRYALAFFQAAKPSAPM